MATVLTQQVSAHLSNVPRLIKTTHYGHYLAASHCSHYQEKYVSTTLKLMQCFPPTEVHQQAAGTLANRFKVTTRMHLCPTLHISPILYCTDRLVPANADMMQSAFSSHAICYPPLPV